MRKEASNELCATEWYETRLNERKIMSAKINFQQMSVSEKLRMMELLWDDLCRTESDIPSPY